MRLQHDRVGARAQRRPSLPDRIAARCAPRDPVDPDCSPSRFAQGSALLPSRRTVAPSEIETEAIHAISHQAEQPASGPGSRRRVTSAQEPGAVSRTSVLSMRARGSVDSQAPVRGYFLWVGGALLVLLFAADSPAARAPAKQAHRIAFYASADPDHLRAEGTGSSCHRYQPARLPAHAPGQGDCRSPLAPLSSDVADAVRQPPRHCPSKPMRVTGAPQSRPMSVKRWRS